MTTHIVAFIVAKPGSEALMKDTLLGLVEPTRKEAGSISYMLTEVPGQPGTFATVEHWKQPVDFDLHMQTPYVQAALKIIESESSVEPVIHKLESLVEPD